MASFSAELHVAGHVFPVTHCLFDVTQATQLRGRVSAKVRYGPVQLVLDVPDGDVLPAWAADSQKRQATAIVFLDATGGQPLETLRLPAAYCVAYQEQFVSGDAQGGAYQCHLTLSDPSGWTIAPGGPVSAFVAPAARTHGEPVAAASGLRDMAIGGAVGAAQVAVQAHGKEPVLPLAANVLPANWQGKKDLPSWTEEHKAARWAEYQRDHATDPKAYAQQRWDDSYETGRNNNIIGLAREREYAKAMGAVSAVRKTPFTLRQIDMYQAEKRYCGQLKTGYIYLGAQEKIDLRKDRALIRQKFKVEYILEKGASKPFLAALEAIGASVKIGPQIP